MLLLLRNLPHDTRRSADDQASALETLPLRHQRAGPDDALRFDDRTVQDARGHADQAVIGDRAAVKDRLVPDRHPSSDGQWEVGVAVADRSVLEIGVLA